ncbi:MAG: CRISPR-associated endonuclease Cas1 [Verrucomicrobia bacterium]|nr:CRISPR-associated endonuclease Cas1 [Verrucomicrobiota bacterium]
MTNAPATKPRTGARFQFRFTISNPSARLARGVADTSVTLRRAQFRAADVPARCAAIARAIIAGKLQNSRNSLLRGARESEISDLKSQIEKAADALARQIQALAQFQISTLTSQMDELRGAEGMGAQTYFSVFTCLLKQQRDDFAFTTRNRRPPRDRINCLLSFLYALVRHDCLAALTTAGLDPFVGFLHAERPNRPALALDLMEEFRPWLADRLAVTLINRKQVGPEHFREREGGAVEFTDAGRKLVIQSYQTRKQESLQHPLLDQQLRVGQLPFIQARILARYLRGDVADYVPLVPK